MRIKIQKLRYFAEHANITTNHLEFMNFHLHTYILSFLQWEITLLPRIRLFPYDEYYVKFFAGFQCLICDFGIWNHG